jgi:hypothetical protein
LAKSIDAYMAEVPQVDEQEVADPELVEVSESAAVTLSPRPQW